MVRADVSWESLAVRHVEVVKKPLPTLGAMAQTFILNFWKQSGIRVEDVLGLEMKTERYFDGKRYRTTKRWSEHPAKRDHRSLAVAAFHGGRNETFSYGPTSPSLYHELDLKSAYTTALAAIRIPDYAAAYVCLDPDACRTETLGVARLTFRFPASIRYPCLPVEAPKGRGLIYPLEGETVCTAPEIALARRLGAEIVISYGVIVPWAENDIAPFVGPISEIQARREAEERGSVGELTWKQIGNSIYGKLGQALSGRRVYSARDSDRVTIPQSRLTCPFSAGPVWPLPSSGR